MNLAHTICVAHYPDMKNAVPALIATALVSFVVPAAAQTRPPIPAVVLTHMNTLDSRCTAAGGRPGNGRYVVAQDFTGDGLLDYLLSEGDYDCTGRPGLFRENGQARVDIFVTDRANNALRLYSDTLVAYRVLAGKPAKVQIARKGISCGAGVAPNVQCAAQLAWNGRSFGEAVSVSNAASAPAAGQAPSAPAGTATGTQSAFLADCRADILRRDASASRWVDDECKDRWQKIVASGPATDMLLAVLPASAAERPALATVRQRAAGVRWAAKAEPSTLASGGLGELDAGIEGRAAPQAVYVRWRKTGSDVPYDVAGAMRARGVTLTEMSCEQHGSAAGIRKYAGTAPGRAPFTLTVDLQPSGTAAMLAYYFASVTLDGRHPPQGPKPRCDF